MASLTEVTRPGRAREPTRAFYRVRDNEKKTAAYLGFEDVRQLRIYLSSDRFRPFFSVFYRWHTEERIPGVQAAKILEWFHRPDSIGQEGFGRGPLQVAYDAPGPNSASGSEHRYRRLADMMARVYLMSGSPEEVGLADDVAATEPVSLPPMTESLSQVTDLTATQGGPSDYGITAENAEAIILGDLAE